jgi:hypothetical protein
MDQARSMSVGWTYARHVRTTFVSALENPIDQGGGASIGFLQIRSTGHQTAISDLGSPESLSMLATSPGIMLEKI